MSIWSGEAGLGLDDLREAFPLASMLAMVWPARPGILLSCDALRLPCSVA